MQGPATTIKFWETMESSNSGYFYQNEMQAITCTSYNKEKKQKACWASLDTENNVYQFVYTALLSERPEIQQF